MEELREELNDSINDIANWLIRKPFKNELPAKVLEKLSDSLYSKTVIDAIEKDISIMLEAEKRQEMNLNEYEQYGDDMIYNPINDCPEKGMKAEEFEEYLRRIERRKK